ncbi:Rpn family recombination-promoting nuclease/putative transposase [Thermosynechococcaceae cyanobacterium BACA0444]|uniref:Rpn family recombination-promoting nuclease/putative transposase n=1 Tax=Pseudocalidococcus azoricus BACA0444 TaxID=2918990 RepID=A0AAE4JWC0_9CYAN|nr:Rpn family recombination-promoting nuclease/putative transposase [Pseudocalidococcus azoricus]MDS3860906.1 Rpn family recombination-promoting nuclease/putative transposase [Pseudocalidococcus azoricus BACA0444]
MRSTDNICKYLAEKYPQAFAEWLLGENLGTVTLLKTELDLEPIRADSVTFVQVQNCILHLEFQVVPQTQPPLPFRMLDYWVRLYRRYQSAIVQVLILLKPTTANVPDQFITATTTHQYRVLKFWEEDAQQFLENPALLPFAVLAKGENSQTLIQAVAQRITALEPPSLRQEVSTATQLLAGLKYEKELIQAIFREGVMRESVIYQEILAEGRAEGRQEGESQLILRQLRRRFGTLPSDLEKKVTSLSLLKIEALAEAIFDFAQVEDVQAWLDQH